MRDSILSRFRLALCVLLAATFFPFAATAGEDDGVDFVPLAEGFRKHCVQVAIHGQSAEGKAPDTGGLDKDIKGERPTLVGGYWWDERHVVIADPVIQDRFIRDIEIGLPFSDARFRARVAGRFVKLRATLLEVLPGPGGVLPQAFPLEFVDADPDETILLSYVWKNGQWRIRGDSGPGSRAVSDAGVETVEFGGEGVLLTRDGMPAGLAFGDEAAVDPRASYWFGRKTALSPIRTVEALARSDDELSRRLRSSVLETRLRVRMQVDDDDDDIQFWAASEDDESHREGATDFQVAGLLVGERHVLVPLAMTPEGIARIEEMHVVTPDGEAVPARFMGALRGYMAVLLETERDLPTDELPRGFSSLNPLVVPEEAFLADEPAPARPEFSFFQRFRIDYLPGRRREVREYDRWLGAFRGYRGDTVVSTLTNEADGSLAFDLDGSLVAVALTPRVLAANEDGNGKTLGTPGFRPVDFLQGVLHAADVFDPALRPVEEGVGQRLIDFGVEFQGLDVNTARLFAASRATRGGSIGLLVTHVYPGSMADKAGIREHDILLRLWLEGKNEPMELRGGDYNFYQAYFSREDLSSESLAAMFGYMGPPWPSRDDLIASILTAAGPGRRATVEFLREGEALRADFVSAYTDPDYRSANREKFAKLGLTVKPATYEVRRFFRRSDASGVIVSRVEEGGRASVAGLHRYLLVTQVDGSRVEGVEDFKAKLSRFESGEADTVELMVDIFGKTRLIKIK